MRTARRTFKRGRLTFENPTRCVTFDQPERSLARWLLPLLRTGFEGLEFGARTHGQRTLVTSPNDPLYEPLSAQDASFVFFERRATHMHVAAPAIFEVGALRSATGGVDAATR